MGTHSDHNLTGNRRGPLDAGVALLGVVAAEIARLSEPVSFEHQIVDITPHPVLARLVRPDDGMIGGVEMFCGMFIFRRIAAAHMSAGQADSQVHP